MNFRILLQGEPLSKSSPRALWAWTMVAPAPTKVGRNLKAAEMAKAKGYGTLNLIRAVVNSSIRVVERKIKPPTRKIPALTPMATP